MGRPAKELLDQRKYDPIIGELVDRLGAEDAAALWVRAEQRLEGMLTRTRDLPDAERLHVEGFIYPACAIYLEVSEVFGRSEAYEVMRRFSHEYALENRGRLARLTALPGGARALIKGFGALQDRFFGSAAGFEASMGESTSEHVSFAVTSCPYERHTTEVGAPELCDLFCTNDDLIYGDLPNVRFTRKGTLGRGNDVCDFDLALAHDRAEQPAKVLLVGPGVIGGYLAHVLCAAGHDVTVVARGSWADVLERDGLVIWHYLQHRQTIDHPHVVRELPAGERYDAVFAVMRQDQMVELAPQLSALDTPCVVCVGNNLHVDAVEQAIQAGGSDPARVLFGFQATAGRREEGHLVCVRLGAGHLTVGPAHGEATQEDRALLDGILCGSYRASFEHDMAWWLACHAVAVLPFCYLSYRLDCDLTRATAADIADLTDAVEEAYASVLAVGGMILPEGNEAFFEPGLKRTAWETALRLMARTPIGRLCVTDHCKNAVAEMRALDEAAEALLARAARIDRPTWRLMRAAMPSWDDLEQRWGS